MITMITYNGSIIGDSLEICNMQGKCEIAHHTLPDEWSNVEVSQHPEGDKYRYEVKVNGVLIGSILNEDAQMFEDVRIYGSDPTQTTSQGTMRNMNVAPNYQGTHLMVHVSMFKYNIRDHP